MTTHNVEDQFVPVELPSGLRPYTVTEFYLRPLKIVEVKRLRPVLNSNNLLGIFDIVKECMKPLKPEELTNGDWWYVLAWLRLNTFPHIDFNLPWVCGECGSSNASRLVLSTVKIVELPEEYAEPATITLDSGDELPLRIRRAGYYKDARDYLKKLNGRDATGNEIEEAELAMTIATEGEFKSLLDKMNYVGTMTPEDFLKLEDFQLAFAHGLPSEHTDECKGCGHVNEHVRIRFRPQDLVPIGRSQDSIRNTVQFGKTSARPK